MVKSNNNVERINSIDAVIENIKDIDGKSHVDLMPDVFGRAIKYQVALKEACRKDGNLSLEILQWRGIITLLALKDYLDLEISIEKVDLPNSSQRELAFATALLLSPQTTLFDNSDGSDWNWKQFYVIKMRDERNRYVDIALFSPTVIVYPVAKIEKKMPESSQVSWFVKKKFIDPATCLNTAEKTAVIYWIANVEERLKCQNGVNQEWKAVIIELFNKYKKDIGNVPENFAWFELIDICKEMSRLNNQNYGRLGVNDIINKTVKLTVKIENENIDVHSIFAKKIYCLGRSKKISSETKLDIVPFAHCQFASKYRISDYEGNTADMTYYAFLPFAEEFVNLLLKHKIDASEVINTFSLQLNHDKTHITAEIRFSEIYENGIDLMYVYPFDETIDWLSREITVAMWPPKFNEKWNRYYIYFDNSATGMQICMPRKLKDLTTSATRSRCDIYQCDEFPKAVGMCDRDKSYIGAMFFRTEGGDEVNGDRANKEATVCVDFGTSRTIAYADIRGEDAVEVSLTEEGALPLLLKNDQGNMKQITDNFIPVSVNDEKTYSLYKAFDVIFRPNPSPILDGIIYVAGNMDVLEESEKKVQYLTELKWMTDDYRGWFIAFLEQYCVQIAWQLLMQGVGSINWKYAVPLSLSDEAQRAVSVAWEQNIMQYLKASNNMGNEIKPAISESCAVSCYFYCNKEISSNVALYGKVGYIIADIGGGSIDFALWKEDDEQIMWEASATLAGREIFSKRAFHYIEKFINVLDEVNDDDMVKRLKAIRKLNNDKEYNVAIAFFERFIGDPQNSDRLRQALSQVADDYNREWVREFQSQIALGAAIILFSAGQIVGEAIEKRSFCVVDKGSFYIVLAGNGANLFDWIYGELWDTISEVEKDTFVQMFLAGIESRCKFSEFEYNRFKELDIRIVKSPAAKKEVARGLFYTDSESNPTEIKLDVAFAESDIIDWKNRFIDAFCSNFENERYDFSLMKRLKLDKRWNNVVARRVEERKECCSIMISDVLRQLYEWMQIGED